MDKKESGSFFVAITGEVGSGKTTVSNILREDGYFVFDTDGFSKQILFEEKSIMGQIDKIVSQKVSENGKLDFKKIGQIFDENPELENEFEDWYQPFLGEKIVDKMCAFENEGEIIFVDIPFLQHKGLVHTFDSIWIIESEESKKYERIKKRNNYLSRKINNLLQNSKINKELLPNYRIIDNNHSLEELKLLIKSELEMLHISNENRMKK